MPPEQPSISVIVPTLNEAENIEGIVARILAGGAPLDMEVIVVDDGSRDETQAIVRRLAETLPVTLLARDKPKDGLAGAVLAGARAAKAPVVLVIDADGSHPPEKIPELALPVINGERDMVIGSRYMPGGSTPGWSRKRRMMSRAASACAWPLTDVHDALSGFFAVRRELLADIPPDAAGFKIALEILVRGGDSIRAGEVPIAFRDRELGQSKMGTGVILTYFRRLLALSGWRESRDSVGLAIGKTLLVWTVDFAFFAAAWLLHAGLSDANILGFTAGGALNAWLKTAQLPRETRRGAEFWFRLLFLSLLSLFLRGGVLGTCALAFHWPGLAGIVPAIVTGWTVSFLGYAIFIWPVREQYGRGVRWRVAAIGATAYLLALRVAYLFAMPIDPRTAQLTGSRLPIAPLALASLGLLHFGTALLGPGRAGFNLLAIVCWCVAAWLVFKTTQHTFDKTTAFRSLLLFSVLPVFFKIGSEFSPATVVVTGFAVVLWLLSFATAWEPARRKMAFLAVMVIFWAPEAWLSAAQSPHYVPAIFRVLYLIAAQVLLVTPLSLIAVFRFYDLRPRTEAGKAMASEAAMAGFFVLWAFAMDRMNLGDSGAIWVPLLPVIAFEMQPPGSRPGRWWNPVFSACVVYYGVYFYWLAFAG